MWILTFSSLDAACFARNKNDPRKQSGFSCYSCCMHSPCVFGSLYAKFWPPWILETPLIIRHNGASGVFAGCIDVAYQKAIEDGADVIDCSVQMSMDGVPFCWNSADLMGDTTAMTTFMSRSSMVPEIQGTRGSSYLISHGVRSRA